MKAKKSKGAFRMKHNTKLKTAWILSVILLYLVWSLTELVITPAVGEAVMEPVKELGGKLLLWALPAWLLIRQFDEEVCVPTREAFRPQKRWWPWLCGGMVVMLVYQIVIKLRTGESILEFSPDFGAYSVLSACCIGLGEELVFRGWLLGAMVQPGKEWQAVAVNAVLFLCIHFPIWIRDGLFWPYITSLAFLQIVLLSVVFALSYLHTRSVAVPAILHAWWDMLCFLYG